MTSEWQKLKSDFEVKVEENERLRQQLSGSDADLSSRIRELKEEVERLREENARLQDEIKTLKDGKEVERLQAEAIMKVRKRAGYILMKIFAILIF